MGKDSPENLVEKQMQLAGELAKMNLASLVRLVRNGELTGKICLSHGVNTAFIYFDAGRPLHVETDFGTGREAFMELFTWQNGTFSYSECPVNQVPRSLPADEPLEKLMKQGLAYQEALRYLEELNITSRTVFQARSAGGDNQLLGRMNGKTPLADIVQTLGLSRSEYVLMLRQLLLSGEAQVVEAPRENIQLPDWVVSRLKQDNPDVSEAIVQLVIWADRIKCWLYQADVDLERVINVLDNPDILTAVRQAADTGDQSFHPQEPVETQERVNTSDSYQAAAGEGKTLTDHEKQSPSKTARSEEPATPRPPTYEF
jgi:hypothetical protein